MSVTVQLAPATLWRTCRALANRRRLLMLRCLMGGSAWTVSQVAKKLRMPLPVASQYLRALNARGLLRARREGRSVLYQVEADRAVPHSDALLRALEQVLGVSVGRVDEAFAALTGFTHPRRLAVVCALASSPMQFAELARRTGMSKPALRRHLSKLLKRGYVARTKQGYECARPMGLLPRTLLDLALRAS